MSGQVGRALEQAQTIDELGQYYASLQTSYLAGGEQRKVETRKAVYEQAKVCLALQRQLEAAQLALVDRLREHRG